MALDPIHTKSAEAVAPIWDSFSPRSNRVRHHAFLSEVLEGKARIFEACLGSGTDGIYLAEKGKTVTGNEADPSYLEVGRRNIQESGVNIELTSHDWRELEGRGELKGSFDGVTCVGNSICYLSSQEDIESAVRGFKSILDENGKLVVDERNFTWMLDRRDKILGNIPKREQIARGQTGMHNHLYGGERFFPYPIGISPDEVQMGIWEYEKNEPITILHFHPFQRGELLEQLRNTFGKAQVVQYSDYERRKRKNAGFYQYVCNK